MPPHPKHDRAAKATPHDEKPTMPFDPTANPAVFRQQASDAAKWVGRGVKVAVCYEPNNGAVSVAQWDAAWVNAGAKLIREPSGNDAADAANPNLIAVLCPIQEPDNDAVTAHDKFVSDWSKNPPTLSDPVAAAAAVEAVYAGVEAKCKAIRAAIPGKPIALVIGGEQYQWGKVDMARLMKAADYAILDWYPVQRSRPTADLSSLLVKFTTEFPGKLLYACLECSNQRLSLSSYPNCRCPTVAEFLDEWARIGAVKAGVCLFPQQTSEGGFPFVYDAMPAELVAAFVQHTGAAVTPPPPVVVTPTPAPVPPATLPDVLNINGTLYDRRH